jgi:AcrR family transcriptional regulator
MRADARRNYERLVDAARSALREQGSEASLEEIARRAGVGIGTLYRHFPTRLDLLEAVYRADVDGLEESTRTLLAEEESAWAALERGVRLFIDYAATKRALFQVLVDAVGRDSQLITHSRQVISSSIETLLTRAQDEGTARRDVQSADLIRLVGGCTMMGVLEGDQRERMLRIVLDGIRVA